ncbi:hypothetical protein [Rhizobium aethiopicum]|uniref:Uncharacterized protein n=1 Tax=Rhizobium aethiopicum TaxID=1138170 RepID=A0A7W6MJC2_9HYPH|nr:hypothetical protein [Rhizobium aethiopicum]MBB4192751.1 hypothetical protein [Rhizobium aethiopicum]
MTEQCECEYFNFGDFVRSRQNPHLTGQIIGERSWGEEYQVRLADGASIIWWFAAEIEHDPGYEPTPAKSEEQPSNVIAVDFTKPRALKKSTKTAGEA